MKSNIVEKVKTIHTQAHHYPSRREIITKCESGSFHPILTTRGMGETLADQKRTDKAFGQCIERLFGPRRLNIATEPIDAEHAEKRRSQGVK